MAERTIEIEMPEVATRYRLTVDQFLRMAEVGVLSEDDHLELIDGEIVQMTPADPRHASAVTRMIEIFGLLRDRAMARGQCSVHLAEHSLPEPDVALVRRRRDEYSRSHPQPEDILLLAEVARTSLRTDRERKGPLYARYGVPEYWIVNLADDVLEVYREPGEEGYALRRLLRAGERVAPLAFPDFEVAVADLLVSPAS